MITGPSVIPFTPKTNIMHFPVEKIATPTFYYSLFPTWSWICMEKRIKKKKVKKKKQQEGRRIDHLRRKGLHPPPGFIPIKRTLWYHHNPGIPFNLYTLFWVEKGGTILRLCSCKQKIGKKRDILSYTSFTIDNITWTWSIAHLLSFMDNNYGHSYVQKQYVFK